jgi:glycosyltransferase involved in cell wall biosynthesis
MRCLLISTVAQSLRFQSPAMWQTLKERGAKLTFAAGIDGWEHDLAESGEFIELPMERSIRRSVTLPALRAIRDVLSQAWDYVQVQSPIAAAICRIVAPSNRSYPLVYVAHGFHFDPSRFTSNTVLFGSIERILAARGDMVALVAAADYDYCSRSSISRRVATWHLPGPGIETAQFASERRVVSSAGDELRVLFCGDLNENKDPLSVVDAVASASAAGRKTALTVVGTGPLRSRVLARIETLTTLGISCSYIEHEYNMPALMAQTDVLVAPSYREGVPRVVVEALAAGVPVIARDNRGTRELLSDGIGLILPAAAGRQEFGDCLQAFSRIKFPPPSMLRNRADRYSVAVFRRSYGEMLDALGVSSEVGS